MQGSNYPLERNDLNGIDAGIAVFSPDLELLSHNNKYAELCGYKPEQLNSDSSLTSLIRTSMRAHEAGDDEIDQAIKTALSRLTSGNHKFHYRTGHGKNITITRAPQTDGRIVETVLEMSALEILEGHGARLEQLARLSRERMMHALDAIGDGFALYDASDRLVFYNNKYIDLNPHIADLIKPGADYASMLRKGIERGGIKSQELTNDELFALELKRHRNPGKVYERQLQDGRWIRVLEKRTEDGSIAGIRTDVTELKKRELEVERISVELNATSTQLSVALNNMVQGLCMFDKDQRLVLCNQQYLKMYGFSADIVKPGILLADIMKYSISLGNYRDEDAQASLNARHNPTSLRHRTTIKQFLRDGRVIAVMSEPMEDGGTIATYQDITQVERQKQHLTAYNEKLARSNRELQEFAYVASHDLQEPLRKIEAFGDRLLRKHGEALPDEGKDFVGRMQNAAFRMRQLINDLLSYSRVTTKAKPFEPVDLNEILKGVLSDLQIRLQDVNGTVESENLPTIEADSLQMRQLIQNLLSNALKFRREGVDPVVKITAEPFRTESETGQFIDYIRIRVADNGIGFDNKYKDQIFTIFQRLHGRMEYEGTGIGLATCRKIVERHYGFIDADGVPEAGATFIVDLPVKQVEMGDDDHGEE